MKQHEKDVDDVVSSYKATMEKAIKVTASFGDPTGGKFEWDELFSKIAAFLEKFKMLDLKKIKEQEEVKRKAAIEARKAAGKTAPCAPKKVKSIGVTIPAMIPLPSKEAHCKPDDEKHVLSTIVFPIENKTPEGNPVRSEVHARGHVSKLDETLETLQSDNSGGILDFFRFMRKPKKARK